MSTSVPQKPQVAVLVKPPGKPTIYVEGISQLQLGMPNSRVLMHEKTETLPDQPQRHHLACELVVPTAALVEMCINILNTISGNRERMDADIPGWLAAANSVYDRMSAMTARDPFSNDFIATIQNINKPAE